MLRDDPAALERYRVKLLWALWEGVVQNDFGDTIEAKFDGLENPPDSYPDTLTALKAAALYQARDWYLDAVFAQTGPQEFAEALREDQRRHSRWSGRRCETASKLIAGISEPSAYDGVGCKKLTCPSCAIYRNFRLRLGALLAPLGGLYFRQMGPTGPGTPWSPAQARDWCLNHWSAELIGWTEMLDLHSEDPEADGNIMGVPWVPARSRVGYIWTPDCNPARLAALPECSRIRRNESGIEDGTAPYPDTRGARVVTILYHDIVRRTPDDAHGVVRELMHFGTGAGQHPRCLAGEAYQDEHVLQELVERTKGLKSNNCRFASKMYVTS